MKKILIDVDDVITGGSFIKEVNKFLNTDYKEEDNKGFYLQDLLGDKKDLFFENFENINLYEDAKLADNCYDVMKRINEKYEVYICSAFIWRESPAKSSNNLKYKYDFLHRELTFIDPNNYIFATNKLLINCDIRIDDRISNLGSCETSLLYTAYHNKDVDGNELIENNIIRVNNWLDIAKILEV